MPVNWTLAIQKHIFTGAKLCPFVLTGADVVLLSWETKDLTLGTEKYCGNFCKFWLEYTDYDPLLAGRALKHTASGRGVCFQLSFYVCISYRTDYIVGRTMDQVQAWQILSNGEVYQLESTHSF